MPVRDLSAAHDRYGCARDGERMLDGVRRNALTTVTRGCCVTLAALAAVIAIAACRARHTRQGTRYRRVNPDLLQVGERQPQRPRRLLAVDAAEIAGLQQGDCVTVELPPTRTAASPRFARSTGTCEAGVESDVDTLRSETSLFGNSRRGYRLRLPVPLTHRRRVAVRECRFRRSVNRRHRREIADDRPTPAGRRGGRHRQEIDNGDRLTVFDDGRAPPIRLTRSEPLSRVDQLELSGCGEDGSAWWRGDECSVGLSQVEVVGDSRCSPSFVMQVVVMCRTSQHHLVEIGGPVLGEHLFQMVGFGPSGRPVTSRPSTPTITSDHRVVLGIRCQPCRGAVVEDRRAASGDDPVQFGVATQLAHRLARDRVVRPDDHTTCARRVR